MERMKKRILFVNGPLVGGGAEKVLVDILNNMDYDRYEIDLALITKQGVHLENLSPQVNIIELWPETSFHHFIAVKCSTKLHSNYWLAQRMNSNKLRKDYDVEIAFLEGWPTKLLGLRKTNSKKIAWIHTDLAKFHISNSCYHNQEEERKTYGKMNNIIAVSNDAGLGICNIMPEIKNRVRVINNPIIKHNIINLAESEPNPYKKIRERGGKPLIVVTVARLRKEKNPERLLEVVALSRENRLNVKFIWLGEGEMMNYIINKKDEMGLEGMVEFIGFQKNPYPYIKHADFMMLPSDIEAFSVVTCETMCLHTPVISTATAGQHQLLGCDERGLVTDFSPDALFSALNKLVNNPILGTNLAEAAYKYIDAFSIDRMLHKFYGLLSEEESER